MNVVDIPQPAERTYVADAVARYAARVRPRAVSVHRVSGIRGPGTAGVRLLLVTGHVGLDNRFFYSAYHRLPDRYHAAFPEEPYILPAWSMRVMRYTRHYTRDLVSGRDVLEAYSPSDEPDERWCRMLESYCGFATFAAHTRRAGEIRARETIAAAEDLRGVFDDASAVLPHATDSGYAAAVDEICGTFFESADSAKRSVDAWQLFAAAFDRFDAALQGHLGAANTEDAVAIARARLRGDEECADFDREYAFQRARDIDGYFQELASLGFPYGRLFPAAAHPQAARTPAAAPVLDVLLRNAYRVHRRLTEYAAGT